MSLLPFHHFFSFLLLLFFSTPCLSFSHFHPINRCMIKMCIVSVRHFFRTFFYFLLSSTFLASPPHMSLFPFSCTIFRSSIIIPTGRFSSFYNPLPILVSSTPGLLHPSTQAASQPARLIVGCLYQMYWVHTIHYYILHIWRRGCLVLGKRLCTHVARFDNEYSKLARKDTHLLHVGCINFAGVKEMEYMSWMRLT